MPAEKNVKNLAIIAGGGALPSLLAQACEQQGIEIFIVAFDGQTDPALLNGRAHVRARLGGAGRVLKILQGRGISDLVLIGSIRRPSLREMYPDLTTTKFFASLGFRGVGDDGLLSHLRKFLEKRGFALHGVHEFVSDLLAPSGRVGRYEPSAEYLADIKRGLEAARALGQADVGQSVIVQEGIVLGVEAIEGTDELIRRCGALHRKGRGGVLVKICKPGQDRNLDLPTIGPDTIMNAARAGLAGIAVQAGASLLIQPEKIAEIADAHKLFVVGIEGQ